jgi:hypothetical protein
LSNISPDPLAPDGETYEQKAARERKNIAWQARHNHAQHRKEEWEWYQAACREVQQQRLAAEARYERHQQDHERERQC